MLHVRPLHLVLALALFAALAVLTVPLVAFAQGVPALPAAAPALSVGMIVVLALTFVLGAAKQAQSTGKILGQFTLPASADVVVGLVVPFLGAFLQYLSTVAFSGAACAYAAFAGLAAVTSSTAGALAVHAHMTMPAQVRAMKKAGTLVALAGVAVLAMMLSGCTPAELAAWDKGISAGSSLVVPATGFACTVATDVDPSGATAICQEIDTTGNLVGVVLTVAEDAPAIAGLVAKTSASMQAAVKANHAKAAHS